MTQIKVFSETTFSGMVSKDALKLDGLTKKVNDFLSENDGKITVKDIKYTLQNPNPHQVFNHDVKYWTIMVIYETK